MSGSEVSTRDDAVARAERIRAGIRSMAELQQDIVEAYNARDWTVLGYGSWDAYTKGEFGDVMPRLDREDRRELVVNLRAEGLSTRAIASVVGAAVATVHGDLSTVRNRTVAEEVAAQPAPITGVNGKTYAPKPTIADVISPDELAELKIKPAPEKQQEPKVPNKSVARKSPLPKYAADKVNHLWLLTDALVRVLGDDRFATNRDSIRQQCESELKLAESNIAVFREALGIEKAAPAGN